MGPSHALFTNSIIECSSSFPNPRSTFWIWTALLVGIPNWTRVSCWEANKGLIVDTRYRLWILAEPCDHLYMLSSNSWFSTHFSRTMWSLVSIFGFNFEHSEDKKYFLMILTLITWSLVDLSPPVNRRCRLSASSGTFSVVRGAF